MIYRNVFDLPKLGLALSQITELKEHEPRLWPTTFSLTAFNLTASGLTASGLTASGLTASGVAFCQADTPPFQNASLTSAPELELAPQRA